MKSFNNTLWTSISVEDLESREEFGSCFWDCIDCFCVDCVHVECFCIHCF